MATEGIRNLEWLDRGSDSRYPLQSGATAKDLTGVFELPNDFLASLYLAIPADLDIKLQTVRIGQVIHTTSQIVLRFFAEIAGQDRQFAEANIGVLQSQTQIKSIGYALQLIRGIDNFESITGHLAVARMSIANQPVGLYEFDYDGAGLDIDTIRPNIRFVSAIDVETAAGGFARIVGPLRLRAGLNSRLRVVHENGEPVVYFDALDGSQLNERLECEVGATPPIRFINGIPGDAARNVTISPGRCVETGVFSSTLGFRNACSEPCASCEEAELLRDTIDPLADQIPTLVNFIARLEAAIDAQNQAIALSQMPVGCRTTASPCDDGGGSGGGGGSGTTTSGVTTTFPFNW